MSRVLRLKFNDTTVTIHDDGKVTHSNGDTGRAISGFCCKRESIMDPEMGELRRGCSLSSDAWVPRLDEPEVYFYYQVSNHWSTRWKGQPNDNTSTSQ